MTNSILKLLTIASYLTALVNFQGASFETFYRREMYATGAYDEQGLVCWGDLSPLTSDQSKGLALLKQKRWSDARKFFDKALLAAPNDLTLHHGRIEAMRRLNRIPDLLGEMTKEITKGNQSGKNVTPEFRLAYLYAYALNHYLVDHDLGGVRMIKEPDERTFWMTPINKEFTNPAIKDKLFGLMCAVSQINLNETAKARQIARETLKKWPDFHLMRLMLSRFYARGSESWTDGRGRPLPIPDDEKYKPEKALEEAEYVIKKAPHILIAYYYAGITASGIDKPKGVKYLTYFIERAPKGNERYKLAVKTLEYLKKK